MKPGSDADRITVAQLTATAKRHVPTGWREPTGDQTAAAVRELEEIAGGRADLLAQVAGILLGAGEGGSYEEYDRIAARYCIAAGADPALTEHWTAVGRKRAAEARKPPPQFPAPEEPRRVNVPPGCTSVVALASS